jgi:hypothetical protein
MISESEACTFPSDGNCRPVRQELVKQRTYLCNNEKYYITASEIPIYQTGRSIYILEG